MYLTHTRADRHDTLVVQRTLTEKGYHPGPTDGRFGIRTMRAVVQFQNDHRVEPHGAVDDPTWRLLTEVCGHETPDPPPEAKPESAPVAQPAKKQQSRRRRKG